MEDNSSVDLLLPACPMKRIKLDDSVDDKELSPTLVVEGPVDVKEPPNGLIHEDGAELEELPDESENEGKFHSALPINSQLIHNSH